MLYPVSMFCCGCSVPAGTGVILICHLAFSILFITCASSNIIAGVPTLAANWSPPAQLAYTGFCLMGIPIILAGIYGVVARVESNIRMYFYYLTMCFVVNVVMTIYWCLVENPCTSEAGVVKALSSNFGEAFLCGTMQIVSYGVVTAVVMTEVYCMWVVWSFCEDVHQGRNGPELSELIPGKDAEKITKKFIHQQAGPEAGIVGFATTKLPGPYPNPYGAISTSGEGTTIFGGSQHDTSYPPAP